MFLVFPGVSDSKESACNARDLGLILGLGRSPKEGKGYPLQYSGLENSMDRRAWRATIHESQRVGQWLSNFQFHFIPCSILLSEGGKDFSCLGESEYFSLFLTESLWRKETVNNTERLDSAKSWMTLNVGTRILNFILWRVDGISEMQIYKGKTGKGGERDLYSSFPPFLSLRKNV